MKRFVAGLTLGLLAQGAVVTFVQEPTAWAQAWGLERKG